MALSATPRWSVCALLAGLVLSSVGCTQSSKAGPPAPDAGPEDAGVVEMDAGPQDAGLPGIGQACTADTDCASGHCDLQPTGGYCIDVCTDNSSCPEGSSCQQIGRGTAYCLSLCRSDAQCRPDYECQSLAATCVPSAGCASDMDCPEGTTCNTNNGFCTGAIGTRYRVGSTCERDSQCAMGPYRFCISPDMNFTDGYCSSICSNDSQCGSRAVCVGGLVTGEHYKICMQSCSADSDCREKYNCVDRNEQKFCLAWCVTNSDCVDPGYQCEPSTGLCHPDPDAGTPDAGTTPDDAGTPEADAGQAEDAGVNTYDGGYPAPFPDPPQVVWSSGPVLHSAEFIPIFFANDVASQVTKLQDFVSRVGASQYWATIGADYGVGEAHSAPAVLLDEVATGTITDSNIQQWLRDRIQSGVLPSPETESMYILHYPWSMTISLQGSRSCRGFGGYHSNFQLPNGKQIVYAVVPRCGDPLNDDDVLPTTTQAETHEMIEAATDPQPFGVPGYGTVDDAHYEWAEVIGGGEVGDMCQQDPASYGTSAELGYSVQRMWSNTAVRAGHDPCVPAPPGEVYFNAAPDLPDTLPVYAPGGFVNAKSAHIPSGGSKTITVYLFSDGDTGGPWDVSVIDYGALGGGGSSFSYSLDRRSGTNGDQFHLTIKSVSTAQRTGVFLLRSTMNGRSHGWIGLADQ